MWKCIPNNKTENEEINNISISDKEKRNGKYEII